MIERAAGKTHASLMREFPYKKKKGFAVNNWEVFG